jgi:hypothetical protein
VSPTLKATSASSFHGALEALLSSPKGDLDLVEGFGDGEHFIGAGTDANVLSEIAPADCAGGIDQEFGGSGDVGAVGTAARVQQMVLADHLSIGVAQDGECVSGFACQIARDIGRVDANGHRADTGGLKFGKIFFDAS